MSYDLSARGQLINLAGGAATDGIFTDTLLSIENAIGSAFDDIIVSSDAANRIDGGGGSDTVSYDLSARGQLINLAGGAAADGMSSPTPSLRSRTRSARNSTTMSCTAMTLDNVLDGGVRRIGPDQRRRGGSGYGVLCLLAPGVLINLAGAGRRPTGSTAIRCPRSRTRSARRFDDDDHRRRPAERPRRRPRRLRPDLRRRRPRYGLLRGVARGPSSSTSTARPRPTASTPTRCRRSRTRSARASTTSS